MKRGDTRTKGREGEDSAIEYLKKKGYRIIERNYKNPFGEIDVIAREGDTIVFIEVKTRNTLSFGPPVEAVDSRKQERIGKTAFGYITEKKLTEQPVRFDVVSIFEGKMEVIKDAFDLEGDLW